MDVLGYFHNNFGAPGRALTAKLFFLPGTSSGTLQHWKEQQQQQQHIYVPRRSFKGKKHFHLPSLSPTWFPDGSTQRRENKSNCANDENLNVLRRSGDNHGLP